MTMERRQASRRSCDIERDNCPLYDESFIEDIATRAAKKASRETAELAAEIMKASIYQHVGEGVVKVLFRTITSPIVLAVGTFGTMIALWLKHKGIML